MAFLTVLVFSALLVLLSPTLAKTVSKEFVIHPNAPGDVSIPLDTPPVPPSTCRFTWTAAGATPEKWQATVFGDVSTGEMQCRVGRMGGMDSYLMFTEFEMAVGESKVTEVDVRDNEGAALRKGEEFSVDKHLLKSSAEWSGGQLQHVSVTTVSPTFETEL